MRNLGWFDTRALMAAAAGGVAAAVVGRALGRAVGLAVPVPMAGSVAATLPRAIILLVVLARVRRPGVLTLAAVVEAAVGVALGFGGMMPLSVVSPVAAGLAGDLAWTAAHPVRGERLRLALAGVALAGGRVAAALAMVALLRVPMLQAVGPAVLGGIVAVNAVLGGAAGVLAGGIAEELKEAGVIQ